MKNKLEIIEIYFKLRNNNIITLRWIDHKDDYTFEFNQVLKNRDVIKRVKFEKLSTQMQEVRQVEIFHTDIFSKEERYLLDDNVLLMIHPLNGVSMLSFTKDSFGLYLDRLSVKIKNDKNIQTLSMEDFVALVKLSYNHILSKDMKLYILEENKGYRTSLCFILQESEVAFWKM